MTGAADVWAERFLNHLLDQQPSSQMAHRHGHRRAKASTALLGLAVWCATIWGTFVWFHQTALQSAAQQTANNLQLQIRGLLSSVEKFEHLPYLVGAERSLSNLLLAPEDAARISEANQYLAFAKGRTDVAAVYLIDPNGQTLAASNWQTPSSFVGKNYRFRPYFQTAIQGQTGFFYGVGVTTGEPGAFIAAPIYADQRIIGVVAIKIDLRPFESRWRDAGLEMAIADAQGILFLTSQPRWRYRSLRPLMPQALSRLQATQQYGNIAPSALTQGSESPTNGAFQKLKIEGGAPLLVQAQPLGKFGWQMMAFTDPAVPRGEALQAAEIAGLSLALVLLGVALVVQNRRRRTERQASQRQLAQMVVELDQRIAERTAELSAANDVAVQTGKLAVLGQMAASISHEISQPLAALRTLADNASAFLARGDEQSAKSNMHLIGELCSRMGNIIGELKAFARKEPGRLQTVALQQVMSGSLMLIEPMRHAMGARIALAPTDLSVWGDAVRLEQVMVNLLRNGLDAMEDQKERLIEIAFTSTNSQVTITIRDHGPGLSADALAHLFEPFFTTKPSGKGLGLGLSLSHAIVREMGGTIRADNALPGAEFRLTLPRAPQ